VREAIEVTDILALLTASLIDRYQIERELGAGGMATVYLAHDLRHDRKVALKVLRPELSAILGAERVWLDRLRGSVESGDRVVPVGFGGPYAGLFACRFVKKSMAKLAFTHFDYTCVLELDAAFSDETYAFYTAAWKSFEAAKIPFTFHWGKVNELNMTRLTTMYGDNIQAWIAARNNASADDAHVVSVVIQKRATK